MNIEVDQPSPADAVPCVTEVPGVIEIVEAPAANDDVEVVSTGDGVTVEIPVASEIIDGLSSGDEAAREVRDHLDAVEIATDVHSQLEAISAALESLGGSLQPQSAQFLHLAYDASMSRMGVNDPLPSLEAFHGRRKAVHATTLSMETVGENLQRVWNTIIALAKRAWEALMRFIKHMNANGSKLLSRIEAARLRVHKYGMTEGTGPVHLSKQLAERLHTRGKVDLNPRGEVFTNFLSSFNLLYANARSICVEMEESVRALSFDPSNELRWTKVEKEVTKIRDQFVRSSREWGSGRFKEMGTDQLLPGNFVYSFRFDEHHVSEVPVGGAQVLYKLNDELHSLNGMRVSLMRASTNHTGEISTEVARLDRHAAQDMLDELARLAQELSHRETFERNLSESLEQMTKRQKDWRTGVWGVRRTCLDKMIRNYAVFGHLIAMSTQHALRTAFAYVQAVEQQIASPADAAK